MATSLELEKDEADADNDKDKDNGEPLPTNSLDRLEILESNSSLTEGTATPRDGGDEATAVSGDGTSAASTALPPPPPPPPPMAPTTGSPATARTNQSPMSYISSASSTAAGMASPFTQGGSSQSTELAPAFKPSQPAAAATAAAAVASKPEVGSKKALLFPPSSPKHPPRPMTTIDNSSSRNNSNNNNNNNNSNSNNATTAARKDSDDASSILNIPPVHPFFHQHPYDSDGSDGSFVQKARASSSGSASASGSASYSRRERNWSFDSMASNGSVNHKVANASNNATTGRQPVNPQMLPYHERRKLMQLRRQQHNKQMMMHMHQQQQQQQQHHHQQAYAQQQQQHHQLQQQHHSVKSAPQSNSGRAPPQQPSSSSSSTGGGGGMDPRLMAPYYHQHPPQGSGGVPLPPYPGGPPPGMDPAMAAAFMYGGMPPPPSPYPTMEYPQHPYGYPPPPPPPGSTPQGYPGYPPPPPPPPVTMGYAPNHPYPHHPGQQQQQQQQQQQYPADMSLYGYPPPVPGQSDPPKATPSSSLYSNVQPRLSPYHSLGKYAQIAAAPNVPQIARPPKHSRSPRPLVSAKSTSLSSSQLPPPPPPPPSSHDHAPSDSMGSISSLGSKLSMQQPPESPSAGSHHRRQSSSGSFLEMLQSQWAPGQSPKPNVRPGVADVLPRQSNEVLIRGVPGRLQQHHRRLSSQDRPPPSRGTHKRLPSISNDDWEEKEKKDDEESTTGGDQASAGGYSSSSGMEELPPQERKRKTVSSRGYPPPPPPTGDDVDERTSLLPPPGISTNEQDGARKPSSSSRRGGRSNPYHTSLGRHPSREEYQQQQQQDYLWDAAEPFAATERFDNRAASVMAALGHAAALQSHSHNNNHRKHRKKKHKRKHKSSRHYQDGVDSSSEEDNINMNYNTANPAANCDYRQWTQKRARMLEKERSKLIEQWKAEAREEAELSRRDQQAKMCVAATCTLGTKWLFALETFVANLPLTIGAVAMAVVTLGVVWFKFAEENLSTCEPVHFHSSQCTFPEFPGCFYCDTKAPLYKLALHFHYGCKITAGLLAMLFVLKVLLATRVVLDELSSPTTASPAGLLCMTTVCVFAGRGSIGQFMVTLAACVHICLVMWFVYMALAYRIMPDPSWFPNTVGVGLSAVKAWLYYPVLGHLLMAVCLASNFFFFPISLIRVAINEKISATVGWMQMSAPAISLYALTIMAQPSFEEEHPDVTRFQRVHRMVYLPSMHVLAALSILGFVASCHSLWNRWHDFRKKDFSPAHAAFCFPVLSHVNALQAYRGAIISFSDLPTHSWRMVVLYIYWFTVLMAGTIATLWITIRFLYCLPRWTNLDVMDEEEPPQPNETVIAMRDMVTAGDVMLQPFVSPAILQANETGGLVLARISPEGPLRYIRTRRLAALGFEPTMNWSEMHEEREFLLDWVGKHPPRRRHRTLSVPGLDFSYGSRLGTGNSGVYGTVDWTPGGRQRADTGSPRLYY